MTGIFLILACLVIGKLLTLSLDFSSRQNFIEALNLIILRVALPSLVLDKIYHQTLSTDIIIILITPILVFLLAFGLLYLLRLFIPMTKTVLGCLILMVGTGNTSYVGLPFITALLGEEFLKYAILYDQANFIVVFTAGVMIADLYSGAPFSLGRNTLKLFRFLPIQALILALIFKIVHLPIPTLFQHTLEVLGSLMTPLAILSIGAGLKLPSGVRLLHYFVIGLTTKLIAIPLIIWFLLSSLSLSPHLDITKVIILQAGMAPMVLASIVATEKNLEAELANLLAAIGIPLSFITLIGWYYFLL